MSERRQLFTQLVAAVQKKDQYQLETLRDRWSQIATYIEDYPREADSVALPPDEQAVLLLWLSTPPSLELTPWTDLKEPGYAIQRRARQFDLIEQMWAAWQSKEILGQLRRELRPLAEANLWLEQARAWFSHRFPEVLCQLQASTSPEIRLDVVAGYAAQVDQMLLAQRGYPVEAWLTVGVSEEPPVLRAPDRTAISCEALGQAIHFRSGIDPAHGSVLAQAITLSLPAHPEVLPKVAVELNREQCRLVPAPECRSVGLFRRKEA